ncbi:MAG TPA: hypothetical protein VHD62_07550 [Opitutaceae bacterium]|nr:hypothetical protein [Opitutaceae bacterium]
MKKWMYLVFPGALLGLFLIFYFSHEKEATKREEDRAVAVAKKQAEDKAQKEKAEATAKEAAAKRQAEREEEERKKEEDRRAKQKKIDDQIRDETDAALADADKSQKQVNALELQLDQLHKQKDQLSREAFDLAKQVELARVARRNAELDEQRWTEMIARRAADTRMAQMPPPPAPPK